MAEIPIGVITSNCKVTAMPRRPNAQNSMKIVTQITKPENLSKIQRKGPQEYSADANLMTNAYPPLVSAVNKAMYRMYSDVRR